jgi:hypothetical protein
MTTEAYSETDGLYCVLFLLPFLQTAISALSLPPSKSAVKIALKTKPDWHR